jgi:serine/threonine protein kinase
MVDLVVNLLQFNPNRRFTVEQVLKHPYIRHFAGRGNETNAGKIFRVKNDH